MDLFNDPAPDRRLITVNRNGDQYIHSMDTSPSREGAGWSIPTTSPLATLPGIGGQIIMKYWSHNIPVYENGNIGVRDDAGACSIIVWAENDSIYYYGAPTGAMRTPATFTLYTTYNALTGAWTYVGPITPSQTVGIVGTTAVNNAQAGSVGELISATIATPGTTLTTTATPYNVIATPFLSLTAGDWDVYGTCCLLPATTTSYTQFACGISATSATLPAAGSGLFQQTIAALIPTAIPQCFEVPTVRVSISTTTPYYLEAQSAFTVASPSAFGT